MGKGIPGMLVIALPRNIARGLSVGAVAVGVGVEAGGTK